MPGSDQLTFGSMQGNMGSSLHNAGLAKQWVRGLTCRLEDDLEDEEEDEEQHNPQADMYVKYNACLHGITRDPEIDDIVEQDPPLSVPFMKKFFQFAKNRCRCRLPSSLEA